MSPPRRLVPSTSPFAASIGFSAAVRAGDLVFVAGMTAVGPDRELVGGDDPYLQAREALRKVGEALVAAGSSLDRVVQTRLFITHPANWEAVGRAHGEAFSDARPVATMVVAGLLDPRMLVEIEVLAYVGS